MEIKYDISKYSQKQAYEKIDNFLDDLVSQYKNMICNPEKKWNDKRDNMDFSFEAIGFNIKGDIKLQDDLVIVYGKIPLIARVYSGKIESIIKEQLGELFP